MLLSPGDGCCLTGEGSVRLPILVLRRERSLAHPHFSVTVESRRINPTPYGAGAEMCFWDEYSVTGTTQVAAMQSCTALPGQCALTHPWRTTSRRKSLVQMASLEGE